MNATIAAMEGIGAAFRLECRDLFRRNLRPQALIISVLGTLLLAVGVPLNMGLDFLDLQILTLYACLPWTFVATAAADSVAGSPGWSGTEAAYCGKVAAACAYGVFSGVLLMTLGLAAVNAANWHGHVLLPALPVLAWLLVFSAAGSFFAAAATAAIALRAKSAAVVKQNTRRVFLLLLFIVVLFARGFLPGWKRAFQELMTAEGIPRLTLPLAALLALGGYGLLRLALARLRESQAGPVFKI